MNQNRRRNKKGALWIILLIVVLVILALMVILNSIDFTADDLREQSSSSSSSLISSSSESSSAPASSSQEQSGTQEGSSSSQQSQAEEGSSSQQGSTVSLEDDWRMILVNKDHRLSQDYDVDLVQVWGNYKFDVRAAQALKDMIAGAEEAGFTVRLVSTYRSMATSEQLYQNKVNQLISSGMSEEEAYTEAARWVAPAGTSEHNTGLAVDMVSGDFFNYYTDLCEEFENFPLFDWLYENCVNYGFILRYPKDKEDITQIGYEPWHYRYVGVENAKKIRSLGVCLEEYWAMNE